MEALIKNRLFLFMLLMSFCFVSCSDELENVTPNNPSKTIPSAEHAAVTNVVETIYFETVATIADCHGESIRFWGMLEQRVVKTVDEQGNTHYTRHFRPTDLQAEGWIGSLADGSATGTTYDITGGAEMFSIHYGPEGNSRPDGSQVFIHQGTLVFVNQADGSRVVARHTIRKVPGQDGVVNFWDCGGK